MLVFPEQNSSMRITTLWRSGSASRTLASPSLTTNLSSLNAMDQQSCNRPITTYFCHTNSFELLNSFRLLSSLPIHLVQYVHGRKDRMSSLSFRCGLVSPELTCNLILSFLKSDSSFSRWTTKNLATGCGSRTYTKMGAARLREPFAAKQNAIRLRCQGFLRL